MANKCCPECGVELEPNAELCPECGCPVQSAPKANEKLLCPECGAELEPNAESCPECGCPIQSAPKANEKLLCPECGVELEPNAEFCPECGCPIASTASVGETRAAAAAVAVASPAAAVAVASPPVAYAEVPSVKRSSKRGLIVGVSAAVVVIAAVMMIVLNIPRNVEKMNFNFDGFSGEYSGAARNGVPQGDGAWTYNTGSVRMSAEGEWKNGALNEGTVKVIYNGKTIGNISYYDGKWDPNDFKVFSDAADSVNFANAFK